MNNFCLLANHAEIELATNFDYPPIPVRNLDWSAIDSNTYDADCDQDGYFSTSSCGRGATKMEAVGDLLDQLEAYS